MYKGILHTHYTVVTLFLVLYFVKTILLISNKKDLLKKVTKTLKIPEMIISVLFLGTGIYLMLQLPEIKMLMIIKVSIVLLSIPIAIVGFKKENKLLAALSFFMLVASFGIAEVHHKKMVAGDNSQLSGDNFDAKNFYSSTCAKCHGEDGKAGIMGALDLSTSTLDHPSIIKVMREGRGSMAGNANLTDTQAEALALYVETLRK